NENSRLRIFDKNAGKFFEIDLSFLAEDTGVDLEQQAGIKGHIDPFTYPCDLGIRHGLLDLLSLFVHMTAYEIAGSAADSSANKCIQDRTFPMTDQSPRGGAYRHSRGCSFLSVIQCFTIDEQNRQQCRHNYEVLFHALVNFERLDHLQMDA